MLQHRSQVLKLKQSRHHKVRCHSFSDFYRTLPLEFRKKYTQKEIRYIIEEYIENKYKDSIISGEFLFPFGLGEIKIFKYKSSVKNLNGKIKNFYMPDWDATIKFWKENPDAYKERKVIRKITDTVYYHKYKRSTVLSKSLKIDFLLSRKAKRVYIENINNNKQNAFNYIEHED